jgi:hypothetical protein
MIYKIYFILILFVIGSCKPHPEKAVLPKDWSKSFADVVLPSRCGYVTLRIATPYGWTGAVSDDKNIWTGNRVTYSTKMFGLTQEQTFQYVLNNCAPQNTLIVHYEVYDEKEGNFEVIQPIEKICDAILIENNVLNKIVGNNVENVTQHSVEKKTINGNRCEVMNLETTESIGDYYYFKRGRFSFVLGGYSRNKQLFKENKAVIDSIANTFEFYSF